MLSVRGILHPTDFSDRSDHAFRLACGLAKDYHAPLHVLHVATSFEAYKSELVFEKHPAQYLANDWEKLGTYQCPGVEVHRHLEEGDPVEQIIRFSHTIPCDFIVLGSHGRTGLERLLLGSVAEHVLRDAGCHVIVVKGPVPVKSAEPQPSTAITEMPPV